MGTLGVQLEGILPCLVHWAYRAGTRDFCSALAALDDPIKNDFFLTLHCFNSFVPIAQQAGWAALLGRLSLNVCLCGVQKENNGKGKQNLPTVNYLLMCRNFFPKKLN
jgi:hypothetical protein